MPSNAGHNFMKRDDFLNMVADLVQRIIHDYNNKLAAIEGNIFIIKGKNKDSSLNEDISDIEDVCSAMKNYCNDLRIFYSKKSAGISDLNLIQIIDLYKDRYKDLLKIDFKNQKDVNIKANRNEIEFLIDELFKNTFNHCGKNTDVYINVFTDKENVVMIYEDRGKGVEDTFKIFLPFYSTNPSKKGLGLSYIWGITRRNSISMDVQSETGKYLRFIFRFPL